MKNLLSMAALICSLLGLVSGCGDIKHVGYRHEFDMGVEEEKTEEEVLLKDYTVENILDLQLCKENESTWLIEGEVQLLFKEVRLTKLIMLMSTYYTGFATGKILLTFGDGSTELITLEKVYLPMRYQFICNMPSKELVAVSMKLSPCEGTAHPTCIIGGVCTDVERLGQNTIQCNKPGEVLLYNDSMMVVDTIKMEKGEKYVTNFGVKYFGYIE